jgi:hypothetical protein
MTTAPGAVTDSSRACWRLSALISGKLVSFCFSARVGSVSPSGASFSIPARLTGESFAASRAAAAVLVTPQPVACASSLKAGPLATIAC